MFHILQLYSHVFEGLLDPKYQTLEKYLFTVTNISTYITRPLLLGGEYILVHSYHLPVVCLT